MDQSILQVTDEFESSINVPPLGFEQNIQILQGLATGQTVFQIELNGPYQKKAEKVELAVYVNPCRVPKKNRNDFEKGDHDDEEGEERHDE